MRWRAWLPLLIVVAVVGAFPAPPAILFQGAVLGSLSALIAMGVVLVYRANRVVNFAQAELGGVAGLLAILLAETTRLPWLVVTALGFLAALLLGALIETAFVRRFARAPRVILTVATLGIAQLLVALQLGLPLAFGNTVAPQGLRTPFDVSFTWGPVVFRGGHVIAILAVAGIGFGLAAFLRRTRTGLAIRACAESRERAAQLGVPVRRIGLALWVLAAALSASASLLSAPIVGVPIGQVLGPALLLRALAAAVVGGMEHLGRTFAAAVALGVVEQAVFWRTGRTTVTDAVLFAVILGALLVQGYARRSRADDTGVQTWDLVRPVRPIPPELRALPEVRWARLGGGVALGALALAAPHLLAVSRVNLLSAGLILAIVGVSLVVLTGWAGEISLGQMALYGFGAAAAVKLTTLGVNLLLVLPLCALLGAVVAMVLGVPALRVRGPFLAVTTFAFALAASSYLLNREFFPDLVLADRIGRPLLFGRFDLEDELVFYHLVLLLLLGALAAVRSLRRSRAGRVLLMTRDNPRAAQAFGISLVSSRLVAFAVSGALAGLAGGAYAFHQHALSFNAFTPEQSIRIFALVVLGGLGSLPGVVLGAAYLTIIDYLVDVPGLSLLLSGVGLLAVLMLLPGGLSQALYGVRDRLLRQLATSRDLVVPSLLADSAPIERPPRPAPVDPADALLLASGLEVAFGRTQVVFGVDLVVRRGEILALLGTNGAGKSTVLRAVTGAVRPRHGTVTFDGVDITGMPTEEVLAQGIAMVPGGRGVFPTLTVDEHMRLAAWHGAAGDAAYGLFPVLAERAAVRAGDLSGGEQQMLALAMALATRPRLLLIDELSLGLAPRLVEQLLEAVRAINQAGTTVVVVEQSVQTALRIADRAVFLEKGEVVYEGPTAALLERDDVVHSVFLGGAVASLRDRPAAATLTAKAGRHPALAVEGVSVAFGGVQALRNVSLSVQPGEVLGIIGPNGAGKTTLFDVVSGFVAPTAGRVRMGELVFDWMPSHLRALKGLGRSFQDARLFPTLTVEEVIAGALERHVEVRDPLAALLLSPATLHSERAVARRVEELVELLALQAYAGKFVSELSTGTRRVVELACCLAHAPQVLLLDEPSSGIAQRETEALAPLLLRIRDLSGAALVLIEHDLPLVTSVADRLVAMDAGSVIAEGRPAEVLADHAVVTAYVGGATSSAAEV